MEEKLRGTSLALYWPNYSEDDYAAAQKEAQKAERAMCAGSFVKPWNDRTCAKDARIEWCSDEASASL